MTHNQTLQRDLCLAALTEATDKLLPKPEIVPDSVLLLITDFVRFRKHPLPPPPSKCHMRFLIGGCFASICFVAAIASCQTTVDLWRMVQFVRSDRKSIYCVVL
jgi:hypothetical protein